MLPISKDSKKEKVIFHMDGDAFFVGCEIAKNPNLKGLPVVTGEERGIVSALSYEAKALGVFRGMPIFTLRKKFPKVIVLPGDYATYVKFSKDMFDIVRKYADDVEEYSIDECFADLTGLDKPLYMSYREIAEKIKDEINKNIGFTVSIGLAPTKVLAKVASKWKKPDGLTVITKETAPEYLRATPIEKIWGIGRRTSGFLQSKGINTAFDFATKNINWIRENLSKPHETLWLELNSIFVMEINAEPKTEYSSIQKTRTFREKTNDKLFLFSQLSKHTEDACKKARYYDEVAKKVSFFLKTQDFRYHSFSFVLPTPTNSPETILSLVKKYWNKAWKPGILYRTAGIVLHELSSNRVIQNDLFGLTSTEDKLLAIHKNIDSLENKLEKRLVYLASTQDAIKNKSSGTDAEDLDRNLLFL